MKKRVFSVLMALCLCLTLLPTAALADETKPQDLNLSGESSASGEGYKWEVGGDNVLTLTNVTLGDITLPECSTVTEIKITGNVTVNSIKGGKLNALAIEGTGESASLTVNESISCENVSGNLHFGKINASVGSIVWLGTTESSTVSLSGSMLTVTGNDGNGLYADGFWIFDSAKIVLSGGCIKSKNKDGIQRLIDNYLPDGEGYCAVQEQEGSGYYLYKGSTRVTGDVNFQHYCAVTFDENYNGGNTWVQRVLYGETATRPADPTRTGFTFEDWYYELEVDFLFNFNNPVKEDLELKAHWTVNTCIVTFQANGGTGEMESKTFTYGEDPEQLLPANAFSRETYTFAGWSKSSTATTAEYPDQCSASLLTATENGPVTLYAVWTHVAHTGGTATCQDKAVCTTCGEPYGELDSSNHTGTLSDWQKDETNHWQVYSGCQHETAHIAHSYVNGVCECGAVQPSSGGSSSGGGSSGGSSSSTPSITVPVSSTSGSVNVKATVKNGNASVAISDKQISQVIADGAKDVTVDVSGLKNVTSATLPAHVVEKINEAEHTSLTVALPAGSVTLDETALGSVTENANGKDVTISVVSIPTANLSQTMKDVIGMETTVAAIVDVNLYVNGQKQSSFNGGKLTISVPYTPKEGEDTSKLTVWFITDDGRIENKGGYYDAENKCFVFETEHLSQYLLVSVDTPVFTDVPSDAYYADAVTWAVLNGITTGITETTFGPDLSCTRAQIVTFLWRAAGEPEPANTVNPFSDVTESDYFYKAVLWAVENSITTGVTETTFAPKNTCTRAQAAAFLYRSEQANGGGFTGSWMFQLPFTDVPEWCYEAVAWCYMNGVIQGTSETTFSPNHDCTRAQIVTMLYRLDCI